jgi:hypothetical protein
MSLKIVESLIKQNDLDLRVAIDSMTATQIRNMLTLAIKEQDRDTRHACAETISQMDTVESNLDIFDRLNDSIDKNNAHSEIMNCRDGIKISLKEAV